MNARMEVLGPQGERFYEILTPEALRLRHAPLADCSRYDSLRRGP